MARSSRVRTPTAARTVHILWLLASIVSVAYAEKSALCSNVLHNDTLSQTERCELVKESCGYVHAMFPYMETFVCRMPWLPWPLAAIVMMILMAYYLLLLATTADKYVVMCV